MSIFGKREANPSAKFKNIGDMVEGEILSISEPMQAREYGTGEPSFWKTGRPKMQVAIKLATNQRDSEIEGDDGTRNLWVLDDFGLNDYSLLDAVRRAVEAAGASDLEVGGRLAVQFYGTDPASQNPQNPRKLYTGRYTPAPAGGGMFGQQTQQQTPPPAQQPAAAPQPQQQTPPPPPAPAAQPAAAPQQQPQQTPPPAPQPQQQQLPEPSAPPTPQQQPQQGGGLSADKVRIIDTMLENNIAAEQIAAAAGVSVEQVNSRRSMDKPPF